MSKFYPRLRKWWLGLTHHERQVYSLLFGAVIIYIVHYLVYCIPQPFFIEDSAISFAYARNAAVGDGFVTYAGGERVEGFSNALWTFLITLGYAVGIPVWTSAKVMGGVFGVLTLPYVFGLTHKMGIPRRAAVIAPAMLALSPQFAIWNASGLENSLYVLCLAGGMWHLLEESDNPNLKPWSAAWFCGAAMTRPEAIMYVAVAAFSRLIFAIVDRRLMGFVKWVLAFTVPFVIYHSWRMWYFAWPFPNTYYAKLGAGKAFKPFGWTIKGWKYILAYVDKHYLGYALPLLGVALVGVKGWRIKSYVGLILWLCFVILWDGKWPDGPDFWGDISRKWIEIRVWSILAVAVAAGLMNLGREGWRARSLLWASGASSVFFVLYSGGDWMKAHRWFNIVEIPLIPIFFAGLWTLVSAIPKAWTLPAPSQLKWLRLPIASLGLVAALVGYAAAEVKVSYDFSRSPETSVNDVHRRVRYMTFVQNRLDLDHVTLLDVDMGAHVYFSGWDIVDIAGLVDVPIARHSDYNHKFMSEYLFKERKPDFAHVHGGWARTSRIPKHNEWKREYIEIPGYPVGGRRLHIGNHIRKSIFIKPITDTLFPNAIDFDGGLRLLEHEVPAPEVAPGGWLYVRTVWHSSEEQTNNLQAVFILVNQDGEVASSASLTPGYRWYSIKDWRTNEQVEGKFRIVVPEGLALGSYELKLMLIDNVTGQLILPADQELTSALDAAVTLNTQVAVVNASQAMDAAEFDRTASIEAADQGKCEAAWTLWKNATRHVGRNRVYRNKHDEFLRTTVASCHLTHAQNSQDEAERIAHLERAHFWDHRAPGLTELAHPIAEKYFELGNEALSEEAWEEAYLDYSQALRLNPSLSWARRYAEDARDKRLRIVRPYQKEEPKNQPPKKKPKLPTRKLEKKVSPKKAD